MTAQRRPGREPRRHTTSTRAGCTRWIALNEGRGANPGDTRARVRERERARPLNEGRGANPGDTPRSPPGSPRAPALNEGRGANPGDTRSRAFSSFAPHTAQRRPGREPRRHTPSMNRNSVANSSLNEGRGANPGDTVSTVPLTTVTVNRSTKAGARTPATQGALEGRRGARLRSTKAGARTPATPAVIRDVDRYLMALNEGRGANPGDTR